MYLHTMRGLVWFIVGQWLIHGNKYGVFTEFELGQCHVSWKTLKGVEEMRGLECYSRI